MHEHCFPPVINSSHCFVNHFWWLYFCCLQHLNITFRRDPTNYRPRINKLDSTKDREQKSAGSYYYLDDWCNLCITGFLPFAFYLRCCISEWIIDSSTSWGCAWYPWALSLVYAWCLFFWYRQLTLMDRWCPKNNRLLLAHFFVNHIEFLGSDGLYVKAA